MLMYLIIWHRQQTRNKDLSKNVSCYLMYDFQVWKYPTFLTGIYYVIFSQQEATAYTNSIQLPKAEIYCSIWTYKLFPHKQQLNISS